MKEESKHSTIFS